MPIAKSPIIGGFSTQRSRNAADNTSINLVTEILETKDGKVPGFLFLASGLDLLYTVGSGPIRGLLPLLGLLYVVSGSGVYSVTPAGVVTFLGTIGAQSTPVSMFQNTKQMCIVDGVGAWIVPGGLPLTGGTVTTGGGLYQVGDTVQLQSVSGTQTVYPVITITSLASSPVTSFQLTYPGTTYTTASNVAVSDIQPQAGSGHGLTITIGSVANGQITSASVDAGGSGYAVNDTGIINVGSRNAVYRVTTTGGGGSVTGFRILNPGTAYATVVGAATLNQPGIPVNVGSGFTVNIVAASGPISSATVDNGGSGYVVGAVGVIQGGTTDALYLVTGIGQNGTVTGFSITQPGAIDSPTSEFTQKSTSGSGSGLVVTSPSFGSYVGLVPITVPFSNPVKGDISDGFGLLVFLNQQEIAQSDELDLGTWDPLSFGVADQSPDFCVSIAVIHDEAYILKQNNTEVWIDEGSANFAFGPITSVHIEWGCIAPFSVAVADQELIWLSRNEQGQGVVVMASGYNPVPISTQALVAEFGTYANLGDAIAYARQEGSHVYYVLTFPQANKTWVYDKTASAMVGYPLWHQLAAFDNGDLNRHWGNAFTPWEASSQAVNNTQNYQALSVTDPPPTLLQTASGLNGLPLSFSSFVFSTWIFIPDTTGSEMIFSNQTDDSHGTTNPGVFIEVQNDTNGSPQITIKLWDASNAAILSATYDFATWSAWVNLLISVDTATNQIQVWANTIISGALVEQQLTAVSLTWSSTNPIAASATQPWHLKSVT
jgi:hypothetical protein